MLPCRLRFPSSPATEPLPRYLNCASVPVRLRMCRDNGSTPWSSTTAEVRFDPEVRIEFRRSSSKEFFLTEAEEGEEVVWSSRGDVWTTGLALIRAVKSLQIFTKGNQLRRRMVKLPLVAVS